MQACIAGLQDASGVLDALNRCADTLAADFQRMTSQLRMSVAESAGNNLQHAQLYNEIATTVQVCAATGSATCHAKLQCLCLRCGLANNGSKHTMQ